MMFKESVTPKRPASNAIESFPKMRIGAVLSAALGYTSDQFAELKIKPYNRSSDYDNHMAKVIAQSDVKNCPKWSEMYEFAHDLNDSNLNITLLDEVHGNLVKIFELMDVYIRQFNILEVTSSDELVFFAFEDQEQEPDFNFYQLFLINEISRMVEEQRNIFSGINGSSFMAVILNNVGHGIKGRNLTQKCFDLIVNLQCGLATVAQEYEQQWSGEEWTVDNA